MENYTLLPHQPINAKVAPEKKKIKDEILILPCTDYKEKAKF